MQLRPKLQQELNVKARMSALFEKNLGQRIEMCNSRVRRWTTPQLVCVGSISAESTTIGVVEAVDTVIVSRALIECLIYEKLHRAVREHGHEQKTP